MGSDGKKIEHERGLGILVVVSKHWKQRPMRLSCIDIGIIELMSPDSEFIVAPSLVE